MEKGQRENGGWKLRKGRKGEGRVAGVRTFAGTLIGLLAAALLLSGCSGDKVRLDPDRPVTITVWNYYNGAQLTAFDELVARFNETEGRELGIIVAASSQGGVNELIEAVQASANKEVGAAELPDIFTGYADLVLELDSQGLIAPLDAWFTQKELDTYLEGFLEEGRFDAEENLKILPVAKSTEILFLNKTDWEVFAQETGVGYEDLLTWEGLAETARRYYEWTDAQTPEAGDGKAFFGRDSYANYMVVGAKQLGGEICPVVAGKPQLNLDKEVIRRLWDNFYVPYISGYFTENGRFRSDDAKTGEIIAWVGSSTSVSYFPQQVEVDETHSYPIEGEILPLPNFEGTEPLAVQQGAGMAVTKSEEEHEYASAVFLKWLSEIDQNLDFAVNAGYLPVTKGAGSEELLEEYWERTPGSLPIRKKGLMAALDQVTHYGLYAAKPFENGNEFRDILEFSMVNRAKADRELVAAEIRNGQSREQAVAAFDTDANFEDWYKELEDALAEQVE